VEKEMSATAFTINDFAAQADAVLRDRIERTRPGAIGNAIREDMVTEVKTHLAKLDSERANVMGGRRTHFYDDAARSVDYVLNDNELRIQIPHLGLAQRFFGGVIKPVNAQWITIPARSESYGKRAREFNDLRFVLFSDDTAALVKTSVQVDGDEAVDDAGNVTTRKRTKRSRDEGIVFYWLKKSVTQSADPSVLPSPERLGTVALNSARDYLDATFPNP
jgi:hypothetical protein